jgi:hypothetical protein
MLCYFVQSKKDSNIIGLLLPFLFGAYDSTSMLTLSLAQASYPLHDRIAFISAPSDDKLAISSRYFVRLAIASHSLQVINNMDMWTRRRKSIGI